MTKKQRAEVVELLRCAADVVHETLMPIWKATCALGFGESCTQHKAALAAMQNAAISRGGAATMPADDIEGDNEYRARCLEAAQRVEDKEWP